MQKLIQLINNRLHRRVTILLVVCVLGCAALDGCHRGTCPAYMNGKATGSTGSREKSKQIMPKKMRKKL